MRQDRVELARPMAEVPTARLQLARDRRAQHPLGDAAADEDDHRGGGDQGQDAVVDQAREPVALPVLARPAVAQVNPQGAGPERLLRQA